LPLHSSAGVSINNNNCSSSTLLPIGGGGVSSSSHSAGGHTQPGQLLGHQHHRHHLHHQQQQQPTPPPRQQPQLTTPQIETSNSSATAGVSGATSASGSGNKYNFIPAIPLSAFDSFATNSPIVPSIELPPPVYLNRPYGAFVGTPVLEPIPAFKFDDPAWQKHRVLPGIDPDLVAAAAGNVGANATQHQLQQLSQQQQQTLHNIQSLQHSIQSLQNLHNLHLHHITTPTPPPTSQQPQSLVRTGSHPDQATLAVSTAAVNSFPHWFLDEKTRVLGSASGVLRN